MNIPDKNQKFPLENYNRLCFLKNIVKNPNIIVGDYTYYDDFKTVDNFIDSTLGYYHNTSNDMEISQLTFQYVDAYHFWNQISTNEALNTKSRKVAKEVCKGIDELVIHSYYGRGFLPETNNFNEGKSGVYQIIPQGSRLFSQTKRSLWSHSDWFHPDEKSSNQNSYGQYDWCLDGAIKDNNQVENFFELLDYLFDESNDEKGGVNKYQW